MPPKKSNVGYPRKNQRDKFNRERAQQRQAANLAPVEDDIQPVAGPSVDLGLQDAESPEVVDPPQTFCVQVQASVEHRDVSVQACPEYHHVEVQATSNFQPCTNPSTSASTQTCFEDILPGSVSYEMLADCLRPHLPKWTVSSTSDFLHLAVISHKPTPVLATSIIISEATIGVTVLGQNLKNNHPLWDQTIGFGIGDNLESAFNILKNFANSVALMNVCSGIQKYNSLWTEGIFAKRGFVDKLYAEKPCYRSINCELLIKDDSLCKPCKNEQTNMVREENRREKRALIPRDQSKTNLRYLPKEDIANALRESRLANSRYKRQIFFLKNRIDTLIEKQGTKINKQWSDKFENITKANFNRMSPLMQLFWDQQMKRASLKNKCSMRWHPMMIRLALQLEKTSPTGAESLRNSGFLSLPSKRTIYDYSHFIEAKEGVQQEILDDLRKQLDKQCKEDHERFVVLMHDGMHIKSNIVFDKKTGDLVGYAKLDAVEQEFEELQAAWSGTPATPQLAKEILVFMVKNITTNDPKRIVRCVVALYTLPTNMSPSGLYNRLWEVIYSLESSGIPVLVVTCDGASNNRSCIEMHSKYNPTASDFEWYPPILVSDDQYPVCITVNIASPDMRPLFFIVDVPHWLKTLRNGFANSYFHKKSRRLWNGEDISWKLIVRYFEDHKNDKLRKCMITREHVYLNGFSVMSVSRAAQVLSHKLSEAIASCAREAEENGIPYPPYKAATDFMSKCNIVFDCLNGHNVTSADRFKNDNLAPYKNKDDRRFDVLQQFVDYLEDWNENVSSRVGNFSKKERKSMKLPDQTVTAVTLTVFSFTAAVKYLLCKGATAICGRRFCQDPIEKTIGSFRRQGGCNNAPDVKQVLSSRVTSHALQQFAMKTSAKGNTLPEEEDMFIDDTPVPKRKKSEK